MMKEKNMKYEEMCEQDKSLDDWYSELVMY